MAGFIRRFAYIPSNEVLSAIEGVAILDLTPEGPVEGVSVGVACCVGEFADMTYACAVDGTGAVTEDVRPVEVSGAQDLLDKVGGWDPTIGDFGNSNGNGFASIRGKSFSRLVVAPVFLASQYGFRFVRALPLNTSATNPLPIVPVEGAVIAAGREFRSASGGRVLVGRRVVFTANDPITTGTGGATTNAGAPAATQNFTVAGADFSAIVRPDGGLGIKKGDVVVLGYNASGVITPAASGGNLGAGTYRVAADASAGTPTVLSLEQMDGTNFDFVTAVTISYRVHISSDADSAPIVVVGNTVPGGYKASEAGGYSVPVRPLTDFSGTAADGNWTANSALTPLDVPDALTATTWDPLSGLAGRTHISGAASFTATIQAPNAVASATIDALYSSALDRTISDMLPMSEIGVIWCARTSSTIRTALKTNAVNASKVCRGRVAIVVPELDVVTATEALGSSSPGVGATRHERVIYTWPGVQTYVKDAVNTRIATADGSSTVDGILDVPFDSFFASILSNLNPELNPGQAAEPVPTALINVLGIQRGVSTLEMGDYTNMKRNGIAGVRMDRRVGPVVQSGVTSSVTSGERNINRRRMADYIEDSLAERLVIHSKLPLTTRNKDNQLGEVTDFFETLLSVDAPANQRIDAYKVDDKSGNTIATKKAGLNVILVVCEMLATGDTIVVQSSVGLGVLDVSAR